MKALLASVLVLIAPLVACGGGSTPLPAPGPAAGTRVAAIALINGGAYVTAFNPSIAFDVQLFTITAAGTVIPDGTALANPVAVTFGGGCASPLTIGVQQTSLEAAIGVWIGFTAPAGCNSNFFTATAGTITSAGPISAGPELLLGSPAILAVTIAGIAQLSAAPALAFQVGSFDPAAYPYNSVVSSTCPNGVLTTAPAGSTVPGLGPASLVVTPPLKALSCSATIGGGIGAAASAMLQLDLTVQ